MKFYDGLSSFPNISGNLPANCMEVRERGQTASGVYELAGSERNFSAYCNMTLRGGGWTVIQQRVDGSVAFNRMWQDYRNGFGDPTGNFWLGLQNIRDIVSQPGRTFELYFGLQSFDPRDRNAFSLYKSFSIGPEVDNYTLHIGSLDQESTADDSLAYHNGRQFSTPDRDNDSSPQIHCAEVFRAGWWFHNCHDSLLNGQWYAEGLMADLDVPDGIIWETWAGDRESLRATLMAVRPIS